MGREAEGGCIKSLISRRTTIAAIDMFEAKYHVDLTAFLVELGLGVYTQIRSDPVSLKNQLSDFKQFVDLYTGATVDGERLVNMIIGRAGSHPRRASWRRPRTLRRPPAPAEG